MNELLEKLMKEANLDAKQAEKVIETVANFVKEKFPMLGGAVDQIFGVGNKNDE
jgi:nucleoid DNA-binding protein